MKKTLATAAKYLLYSVVVHVVLLTYVYITHGSIENIGFIPIAVIITAFTLYGVVFFGSQLIQEIKGEKQ